MGAVVFSDRAFGGSQAAVITGAGPIGIMQAMKSSVPTPAARALASFWRHSAMFCRMKLPSTDGGGNSVCPSTEPLSVAMISSRFLKTWAQVYASAS